MSAMKRVLVSVAALALLLSLFACGGDDGAALVGTWEPAEGIDHPPDTWDSVTFRANGHGEFVFSGAGAFVELFQWRADGSGLYIRRGIAGRNTWGAEEAATFHVYGNQLVLTYENGQLVLVRRD